jgi:hypothetical protein
MNYKCKECEHEFEGLSFINKCEKCDSGNIKRNTQNSSSTIWIILLILLIGISLIVYNLLNKKTHSSEETISYSSVFHKITNGNEINFFLVEASESDTIKYDHKEHNWLKLEIIQETRNYSAEYNTVYPCNGMSIRYHWAKTDSMKTDKTHAYIDKSEFSEDFSPSNKAECPVEWKITMVSARLDDSCNFIVTTDHPDNLQPELSESTKKELRSAGVYESDIKTFKDTDLSYYTKGKKIIKISISGKNGPYEFRNKWKFERGMELVDIWAVAIDFPNDTKRYDFPVVFDTTCFITDSVVVEGNEVVAGEIERKIDFQALNEKKKQEVISHYSGILNDVENNWDGVYKFSGDVVLNGEPQKSFPGDVMSAIDDGKRVVVKDVICIQGNVVKIILEIK